MDFSKQNAIKSLANKCNGELKKLNPNDIVAIREVMDGYEPQCNALGLSRVQFLVEIRYINHPEHDRRMN